MVAFLEKSTGSAGFHQIIDFLIESPLLCYSQEARDKLTFQKGAFSPQWRFLIHCILHCISPKKTAWEQFSSNIATAVICLATNRKFNFSRMIFEHMVSNISSPHKFLMYPRFIQICLDMQRHQLQQHTRIYPVPSLSMKVFNNMKRPTKGYSGQEVALFPTMIDVTAPSTSLLAYFIPPPSHSPGTFTFHYTFTSLTLPLIIPLLMVKKLEARVKIGKARRQARVILSDDEDLEDDSSKQGRKLSDAEIKRAVRKASDEFSTSGAKKEGLEQERLSYTEAIDLKSKWMRNKELKLLKMKRLLGSGMRKKSKKKERAMDEAKSTKKIDWNDPSVIRYQNWCKRKEVDSLEKAQEETKAMAEDAEKKNSKDV
ncbi:hypothetical protein Tco_0599986 [Tanacetum coccineum]|uniref:Uncharacterized protein n=1 Tax=Tanacetum coccineum TaxID=301880 RepID=A0ABQ4WAG9_9ASTR